MQQFVDLARRFHEQSDFSNLPFSARKVEGLVRGMAGSKNGYVRVAEVDGVIEAAMACSAYAPHYSEALVVQDLGLFVDPAKRGSRLAVKLVEDMIAWAQAIGAQELWMGVIAGIDDEAAGRLYEHFGFKDQGTFYRRKL